jgi:hypothetical protein
MGVVRIGYPQKVVLDENEAVHQVQAPAITKASLWSLIKYITHYSWQFINFYTSNWNQLPVYKIV